MVRIDLASVPAGPIAGKEIPALEIHERVVLTPQAFLRSMRLLEDIMKKMADAGVFNPVSAPEKRSQLNVAARTDPVH